MASVQCTTIYDLNEDCAQAIFFYLSIADQFKIALILPHFHVALANNLTRQLNYTSEIRENFTTDEQTRLLSKFGNCIKHIVFDECIDESNYLFYELIPEHCHNIITVDFFYPSSRGIIIYRDTIWANEDNIIKVSVRPYNRDCYVSDLEEYETELYDHFWYLENLKSLNLYHLNEVTGENFNRLYNLTDLNVELCSNYDPYEFVTLCDSSVRLKSLNIHAFLEFTEDAVESLVQMQTDIEEITFNNCLPGFDQIAQLPKLQKVTIYETNSGMVIDVFLKELVQKHRKDLKVLRIVTQDARNIVEYITDIFAFENLEELHLPNYKFYSDDFVRELPKKFKKLKSLWLYIYDDGLITDNGFVELTTNLINLTELVLYRTYRPNPDLWPKISSIRKKQGLGLLRIYTYLDSYPVNYYEMASVQGITIHDLNEYCVQGIFFYLSVADQFKIALISSHFHAALANNLTRRLFHTSEITNNFTTDEQKRLLSNFGNCIKHIVFDEYIHTSNCSFYELVPKHCRHIITIEFFYPSSRGIIIYKDTISVNANHIIKIGVRPYNRDCCVDDLGKYETELYDCFVHLKNLQSLNLYNLNEVTGKNFHVIHNLTDLSVALCSNYESDYFIQLCNSSIRLKSLNLHASLSFTEETVMSLVQMQNEIEDITFNNCLPGFDQLAQLPKLQKVTIFEVCIGTIIDNFLRELTERHRQNLKVLRIITDNPRNIVPYISDIFAFENLEELHLPDFKLYSDDFVKELVKRCNKLKTLWMYIHDDCLVTGNGIFKLATSLMDLKELVLYPSYRPKMNSWERIRSNRLKNCVGLLRIYTGIDNDSRNFYEVEPFLKKTSILQLNGLLKRHKDALHGIF